jgi:hypothetical protein
MPDSDSHPTACPFCGADTPDSARFCAQCGTRLEQADDADALGADAISGSTRPNPVSAPAAMARSNRHVFGLAPPELMLVAALVALLLGVYFLAVEHWIVGGVLLVLALGLGRLFLWTAKRVPERRVAQLATAATSAAADRAELARVSVSSWSAAGWQVLRLRQMQRRLESEQSELIRQLGEAVVRDDWERADRLKAEARACGERIEQLANELRRTLETARERVNRERIGIQRTEVLAREQTGAPQAEQ